MGQRVIAPELQALYDKGAHVYSYSKLGTVHDCPYNAYLTYIKPRDQAQNVYSYLGSVCHDVLEGIIEGKNTEADISPAIETGLEELDMLGVDFPKTRDGGNGIRDRWVSNMRCMARDWVSPKGKYEVEKLLILKLSEDRYLQGYADLIRILPDGRLQVLDIKTSSQFKDEDLLHYGRQLIAYTLALEQAGFTCCTPAWIMVKYCKVTYETGFGKRAKPAEKILDRCKVGYTLRATVRSKMKAAGYTSDEIERVTQAFIESNDVNDLPQDIRCQFRLITYVRPYPVTDELRKECIDYINETADDFEAMQESEKWPAREIEDEKGNPNFFCTNLCGHRKTCEYLRDCINKRTFYSAKDPNMDGMDDLF